MKKIINVSHFLVIIIFLNSCASTYSPATTIANKSYIGMPINEFKSLAGKKASLEVMDY